MKKTLFCLLAMILALTVSAQTLPTDGRVLHFDFNGNVVEKNSGRRLKQLEDNQPQNIRNAEYVDLSDGNKAFVANGKFVFNQRIDQGHYANITVVMRLKATNLDGGSIFFDLYNNPQFGNSMSDGIRNISVSEMGQVYVQGRPAKDSEEIISLKTNDSIAGKFATIIATFTTDTVPQTIALDSCYYSFYEAFPYEENDNKVFDNIVLGYDSLRTEIDYMAVYNRLLTIEEMESIVGGTMTQLPLEEDLWEKAYSFPYIAAAWLVLVVIWVIILLRRKMYPTIDEEYIKSRNGGVLNNDPASKAEAQRLLDKAKSYWNWEESELRFVTCNYPKKYFGYRNSKKAFEQALATGYIDDEIRRDYNNVARALNKGMQYSFHGISKLPVLCLAAYLLYYIGFEWFDGHLSFWQVLKNGLISPMAFSYYVFILSYIIVCHCPNHIGRRGKPVDMSSPVNPGISWPKLADFQKGGSKAGGYIGWIFAAIGIGCVVGLKALGWALSNSVSYFNVFRNGIKVGTTTAFNPTGMVALGALIVAIATIMLMFSILFSIICSLITPIRFIINYILRL